jgi:hypothetical protein
MIGMRRNNDIGDALISLTPKARWAIRDNDYDQIEWQSEDISMPTRQEIEIEIQRLTEEEPYSVLREIRNWHLQQCDWTQAQDIRAVRGQAWCDAWDSYRQQLRDLPSDASGLYFDEFNNIQNIVMPEKPAD